MAYRTVQIGPPVCVPFVTSHWYCIAKNTHICTATSGNVEHLPSLSNASTYRWQYLLVCTNSSQITSMKRWIVVTGEESFAWGASCIMSTNSYNERMDTTRIPMVLSWRVWRDCFIRVWAPKLPPVQFVFYSSKFMPILKEETHILLKELYISTFSHWRN